MHAIITVGISGSGKTTWAEKWCNENPSYVNINRDDIRWGIMAGKDIEPSWKNWRWGWEDEVDKGVWMALDAAWIESCNIVISDTNLDPKKRRKLIETLEREGYEVELRLFPIELDEAIARDQLRAHPVGARVIEKQYEKWLRTSQ